MDFPKLHAQVMARFRTYLAEEEGKENARRYECECGAGIVRHRLLWSGLPRFSRGCIQCRKCRRISTIKGEPSRWILVEAGRNTRRNRVVYDTINGRGRA